MRRFLALAGVAAVLAACTSDPLGDPLVGVIRIDVSGAPTDGILLPGNNRTLQAAAFGPGDVELESVFEWSSSDPLIATVSEVGALTAVAPGEVTIRVKTDGITESVPISVREGTTVPTGGTRNVTIVGGRLRLTVPSNVAPSGTLIHARAAPTWPANARIVPGTVMEIGPAGLELLNPITVGITFTLTEVPAGERSGLRLHAVDATGAWVELPNGTVDLNNLRVSGAMVRLSTVAMFRPAT